MLEALQDIEIATSLLQGDSGTGSALDESYKKLNTAITPLDKESDQYKVRTCRSLKQNMVALKAKNLGRADSHRLL